MSDGLPDKRNPLSALKGQGVSYFDWSYDRSTNTFTGVQKRDIPGYFQTSLTVGFQANNNSPLDVASNGFQIKLKTPAYLGVPIPPRTMWSVLTRPPGLSTMVTPLKVTGEPVMRSTSTRIPFPGITTATLCWKLYRRP